MHQLGGGVAKARLSQQGHHHHHHEVSCADNFSKQKRTVIAQCNRDLDFTVSKQMVASEMRLSIPINYTVSTKSTNTIGMV